MGYSPRFRLIAQFKCISVAGTITNIPKHMVTDQFGMIGLLTFIRAAETEPNLVTLALGRYRLLYFMVNFISYSE
jgi:hypothetical protein